MPGMALYLGSTGRHSRATWGGKGLARSSSQLQGSNSAHQDLLSSNLSCSLREDGKDKKKPTNHLKHYMEWAENTEQ